MHTFIIQIDGRFIAPSHSFYFLFSRSAAHPDRSSTTTEQVGAELVLGMSVVRMST
jgi:hypothetical protein